MATPITPAHPRISEVASCKIAFTAFQALWIPGTTRICAIGSDDAGFGIIQIQALSSSSSSSTKPATSATATASPAQPRLVHQAETEKKVQFKCGTFRASARSSTLPHLLTGDFDGHVSLWDMSRTEFPVSNFKAHDDIVSCMDGAGSVTGRPEFVTGCNDGTVRLWDMRQDHKAAVKGGGGGASSPISDMSPRKRQAGHDVWCVAMGSGPGADDLMIVSGHDNGDVRVMDLRMGRSVFETNIKHGVCAVEFDKRQGKAGSLVATTLEGALHSFDLLNGQFATSDSTTEEVITVRSGDVSTLWQARHVPQRPDIFAVTDGGGTVHMYRHGDERSLITSLGSHQLATEGVLSLDFNEDLEGLFVGCDLDNTLRVGMVHF